MTGWLRGLDDPAPAGRIVCFPHAGGTASFFHPWRALLPGGVGLLAVQYPGHADRVREPHAADVAGIAVPVARALDELDGPLVLFGHSMGATVAHDVARRLGRPVTLVASGRPGPSRARCTAWHRADDDTLWGQVTGLGGVPDEVADVPELRDMVLPSLRADYAVSERHHHTPGPPLPGPVVAMIGDRDPEVTRDEAAAWAPMTSGGFGLSVHPGDHFYLVPRCAQVVREVSGLVTSQQPMEETPCLPIPGSNR